MSPGKKICFMRFGPYDNPRLIKSINALVDAGYSVDLLCVASVTGHKRGSPQCDIFETTYYKNSIVRYLVYIFRSFLFLGKTGPDYIHCSNEETSFPVLCYKFFTGTKVILDIYDSLPDRIEANFVIRYFCSLVARISLMYCDLIIVCDDRRLMAIDEKYRKKCLVIENSPDVTASLKLNELPIGDIKIGLIGNLTIRRGVDVVLEALAKSEGVKLVIAGPIDEYSLGKISNNEAVEYHGILDADGAMELLVSCDASFSFYEPTTKNHIFASPSKIFDAMSVGRYIIVNTEAKVSQFVLSNKIGYSCSYYDSDKLAEIFVTLKLNRVNLTDFANRSISNFNNSYSWKIMAKKLVSRYALL